MDSLSNLIEQYIEAVIIHGEESSNDYRKANKYNAIYTKCYCELCKLGQEGISALKCLLSHEKRYVRYSVAYHIKTFLFIIHYFRIINFPMFMNTIQKK